MFPKISLFNFNISTYALAFGIGIIFDFLLLVYIKKLFNVNKLDVICCFSYWLISIFLGAKLFYIIENINLFLDGEFEILDGGFSFTGGIIGGFLGIFLYCKQYKLRYKDLSQVYVVTFPLVYSFGKIGCFMAGCCKGVGEIPLQLIEALASFIIFLYVLIKIKDNSIMYKYLVLYSITRFAFDFLRESRNIVFTNLTITQLVCILLIILTILVYFISKKDIKNFSEIREEKVRNTKA